MTFRHPSCEDHHTRTNAQRSHAPRIATAWKRTNPLSVLQQHTSSSSSSSCRAQTTSMTMDDEGSFMHRLAAGENAESLVRRLWRQAGSPFANVSPTTSAAPSSSSSPSLSSSCASSTSSLVPPAAVAAALVFASVEDGAALDCATRLFLAEAIAGRCTTTAATRALLHESTTTSLAYHHLRSGDDASSWKTGMWLLHQVPPSPATLAASIAGYARVGAWQHALRSLMHIPTSAWTEMDVAGVIRSIYRANLHPTRDAAAVPHTRNIHEGLPLELLRMAQHHHVSWSSPSALNDALGILASRPHQWRDACEMLHLCLPHLSCSTTKAKEDDVAVNDVGGSVCGMRPNPVTVYQCGRALRAAPWNVALAHVSSLASRCSQAELCADGRAVEVMLRTCMRGRSWATALQLLRHARVAACAQQGGGPPLFKPALWLALIHFLSQHQPSRPAATSMLQHGSASKHYSSNTISRAHNTLLQHATTVKEAEGHLHELKQHAQDGDVPLVAMENESYAHLATLYAKESMWCQALSTLQLLIAEDPRRRLYLPTAQLHDAVQYAIASAPPPGATWEVSVRLFTEMCSTHQVPLSEVAFQSAIRHCLAQGAEEAAQALFGFVIAKGVQ